MSLSSRCLHAASVAVHVLPAVGLRLGHATSRCAPCCPWPAPARPKSWDFRLTHAGGHISSGFGPISEARTRALPRTSRFGQTSVQPAQHATRNPMVMVSRPILAESKSFQRNMGASIACFAESSMPPKGTPLKLSFAPPRLTHINFVLPQACLLHGLLQTLSLFLPRFSVEGPSCGHPGSCCCVVAWGISQKRQVLEFFANLTRFAEMCTSPII